MKQLTLTIIFIVGLFFGWDAHLPVSAQEENTPQHAIYVWRGRGHRASITLSSAATLANFAVAEGIQTLYYDNYGCGALTEVCTEGRNKQDAATLAPIITLFHAQELRVEALYTDNTRIAEVVAYNSSVQPNERFDAIRLNIEAGSFASGRWPSGGFEPSSPADLDVYTTAVSQAGDTPVNVSISFHWDNLIVYNGQSKPAYQHILDIVAGVDIQTAQDTANTLVNITKEEICYANQVSKPAHVTIETFDVVKYVGLNHWNTFFDQGEAGMKSVLATVNYGTVTSPCIAPVSSGYAYHFYTQSYGSTTLPGWMPTNAPEDTGVEYALYLPVLRSSSSQ